MLATLQKFGLRHYDLPTMVWNAAVLLRGLALDVDARNTKPISIILYVSSSINMGLYLYTYHLSTYWFLFWRGGGTMFFNVVLISLCINSFIGVVKLLYMYTNGTKLKKIVSGYLECDAALEPGSRMSRNVNATLRSVKKRAITFWVIIMLNGVIYVLIPILTPGRHLPEDDQILLGLEPMFESPNFEIASIAFFSACIFTVYTTANTTGLIIIIVGYTEAQLYGLAQELLNLWDDAESHYKQVQPDIEVPGGLSGTKEEEDIRKTKARIANEYVKYNLIRIMKTHATNINLIRQIENIFKGAIAIEFTLLSCGLIAELCGGLENTYMEVPFGLVHVTMDCITGQRLMDANDAFERAVYACRWEHFDISNRRLVLVVLQMSQKTMTLSAGGLVNLSYMSLMSVFKSIYSAYTTLRSTMH